MENVLKAYATPFGTVAIILGMFGMLIPMELYSNIFLKKIMGGN